MPTKKRSPNYSRNKGARAESDLVKLLRVKTGLQWERVPGSGALDEKHGLKGDCYVPNEKNLFCVEVKHYAEDHLTSKLLTSKTPQLLEWWSQAVRQGKQVSKLPMLFFKFDRSKWFVAFTASAVSATFSGNLPPLGQYLYLGEEEIYLMQIEEFFDNNEVRWILTL